MELLFLISVDGDCPLHLAARLGRHDLINIAFACGQSVNISNHDSVTPLHEAAGAGHVHCVKALLLAGAHVSWDLL